MRSSETLNYTDFVYLSNSRRNIFNFQELDLKQIKERFKCDIDFLKQNDITNFSVNLIVEKFKSNFRDLGANSFVSQDQRFIYHIAISDFTESYNLKPWLYKKLCLDPETYCNQMMQYLNSHLFAHKISESDK